MQAQSPAPVADGDDTAVRAAGKLTAGFDLKDQSDIVGGNGNNVESFDAEHRVGTLTPASARAGTSVEHCRLSLWIWLLARYQIKETPSCFQANATPARGFKRREDPNSLTTLICEGPAILGYRTPCEVSTRLINEDVAETA